MYDIIGDIHGYASKLTELLLRLGYSQKAGVWQHPDRQAIFVGDFVDRGPEQVQTVMTVKDMVDHGHALAVMGNHELNAIAWMTPDPDKPNEFMRPHVDKNDKQHRAFLEQVGEGSELHHSMVAWFKLLPLYLELDRLRIVHACWHEPSLQVLEPILDAQRRVKDEHWVSLLKKGTPLYKAGETLLKGLEIPLPKGHKFLDKDKNPRTEIRTKWWLEHEEITYQNLAMVPPDVLHNIPHEPIAADVMPGYVGDKVLFVGHYWMSGKPAPLSEHVACVDYSVAAEDADVKSHYGKLCAYRYDGEVTLREERFVWVDA